MKELIIIGAGPAGLACSIYASRFKIDHLIIAKVLGGTLAEAHIIQNYPGIKEIKGQELAEKMLAHAKSYGVEIIQGEVTKIQSSSIKPPISEGKYSSSQDSSFQILSSNGQTYQSQTLFLGLGTHVRRLDVPGEKEFLGKGVAYCAACDAPLFKGKTIAVIGGGNAAATAALQLAEFCLKVYLINRGGSLRAEPFWQDKLKKLKNVLVIPNTNIVEVLGNGSVERIKLDRPHNGQNELKVEGVFIEIGATPAASLAKDLGAKLTPTGLIKITPEGQTSIPGVWAGGDVATAQENLEPRQIVHATSEGAMAALSIFKHLRGQETKV